MPVKFILRKTPYYPLSKLAKSNEYPLAFKKQQENLANPNALKPALDTTKTQKENILPSFQSKYFFESAAIFLPNALEKFLIEAPCLGPAPKTNYPHHNHGKPHIEFGLKNKYN